MRPHGVAATMPLATLVTILTQEQGFKDSAVAVADTEKLKQLLFTKAYQLSMNDIPLPAIDKNGRIQYSSPDEQTLYIQQSTPLDPAHPDQYTMNALYTFNIRPEKVAQVAAQTWLRHKLKKDHRPLFYILARGARHFEKHSNPYAVQLFMACQRQYYRYITASALRNQNQVPADRDEVYSAYLRVYYPVDVESSPHDRPLLEALSLAGFKYQRANYDFTPSGEYMACYRVEAANASPLKQLAESYDGHYWRAHTKRESTHFIFGKPLKAAVLSSLITNVDTDQRLVDEDGAPLWRLMLTDRQVEHLLAPSPLEKTILAPIFHNPTLDALGYQRTGAWLNVHPFIVNAHTDELVWQTTQSSQALQTWYADTTRVQETIQKNLQLRPLSMAEASHFVLTYWATRQFVLTHYPQINTLRTSRQVLADIQSLAAFEVNLLPTIKDKPALVMAYERMKMQDLIPWQQHLVHHYKTVVCSSPFIAIREQFDKDIADGVPRQKADENYARGYWDLMLKSWRQWRETLWLGLIKSQSPRDYESQRAWYTQTLQQFYTDPQEMQHYIISDFNRMNHVKFALETFSLIDPSLPVVEFVRERKRFVNRLQNDDTLSIKDMISGTVKLLQQFHQSEVRTLEMILDRAASTPKPVFIQETH